MACRIKERSQREGADSARIYVLEQITGFGKSGSTPLVEHDSIHKAAPWGHKTSTSITSLAFKTPLSYRLSLRKGTIPKKFVAVVYLGHVSTHRFNGVVGCAWVLARLQHPMSHLI
jgi:hypothetical protein